MNVQEPSMQLLAEAAQNQTPLSDLDDQDNQSSSLSDIDDNHESDAEVESENELSIQLSEGDAGEDTEAETERLGESPDKSRVQKKVLLKANNEFVNTNVTPNKRSSSPVLNGVDQEGITREEVNYDMLNATSPISSPADSADNASPPISPTGSMSRKRKRRLDTSSSEAQLLDNAMGEDVARSKKASAEFVITSINGSRKVKGTELLNSSVVEHPVDNATEGAGEVIVGEDAIEGVESNEDDVDIDEAAPEADINTKSEGDLALRKEAAEKVSTIEEQFAIFRDRMFGEAVANINAELASLERDDPTHPEYLAISAAISRQSQARKVLARKRFTLQVKNWQKRGIADQRQFHSQYAQSCRDIRDEALTTASDEWYQIQKGRRSMDDSVAIVSLSSCKRLDLVAQQTAYNTEVSILSGIAKHVGFPAAPEIMGATQSEIEEDLKSLGKPSQAQQSHVSTSISQILRQNLVAEKQFSKNTPWANAQHHVHSLHSGYPWSPARPNSPFTPASQSQQGDIPIAAGSASTIIGSLGPTPLSSEVTGINSKSIPHSASLGETPSRNPQSDRPRSVVQTLGYVGPRTLIQMDHPADPRIASQYSSPGNLAPELKMGLA